ncbi:hypothetical protein C0993_004889 [Termitomyces sp. T159_Od127]|nr:hypothetical protein C0993_004889 [Termitomyces sp. T159_Od127]
MVQTYSKHVPAAAFGLVCSSSSNSQYDGRFAYVPGLEDVLVWDVKTGTMVAMWHEISFTAEVTAILQSPKKDMFAVGYADGSIRLWNPSSKTVISTFNGHKKSVTALAFDEQGTRLASGSQDTDLILWDVVAEAGLFRLRGHRDQITAIRFLTRADLPSTSTASASGLLLTSSKDTFLKLWDLSTQHCIQTVVAHRSEVWTIAVNSKQDLVFTGSNEGEMKAWRIDQDALAKGLRETESGEPFLAVQSHDRSVEIFRIRSEEEVRKKQMRRKKREKEKQPKTKSSKGQDKSEIGENGKTDEEIKLVDLFTPYLVIRASGKIRSFDFGGDAVWNRPVQIMTALASNALEVYNIPQPAKSKDIPEAVRCFSVDLPGHRTDVRTLSLSSDDEILASASNDSLKIWNMKTNACIRTIDCGYAISSTFLPGDRYVAVGTKSGEILIYDLASSSLIETIQAHKGTVWSLHVRSDQQALVSGSADKDIKFWEFEHKNATVEGVQNGKKTTLVHTRTLKMTDEVLAVRYSPNGKFLAVSLLDSTVKVFYQDSLKFFLSLYGHKLPVLSMDISHDSKLIVTCSADKNVKIWGLDFGDCHKSLFAHDESVMQVAFEKDSHCFWTVGKDKLLKYWDGDKFEHIQNLRGHQGEIWALALSHHGKFVVTGSRDKSIRVWDKDEGDQVGDFMKIFNLQRSVSQYTQIFLEEERERELEVIYENGIADSLNRSQEPNGSGVEGGPVDTSAQAEVTTVTKQTAETLMAGERIMEAIDLADKERATFQSYNDDMSRLPDDSPMRLQPPPKNQLLVQLDKTPDEYVLWVIEKVRSSALHDALLVLPFGKVVSLMEYLNLWAQKVNDFEVCPTVLRPNLASGSEYPTCITNYLLPTENPSSSDRREPYHAFRSDTLTKTPSRCLTATKAHHWIQPRRIAVHSETERCWPFRSVL